MKYELQKDGIAIEQGNDQMELSRKMINGAPGEYTIKIIETGEIVGKTIVHAPGMTEISLAHFRF